MTREQIKATVEGLDAISKGVVSGRPDMVARDALTYKGYRGGRTPTGDSGGVGHKGNVLLCLECTLAFLAFVRERKDGL